MPYGKLQKIMLKYLKIDLQDTIIYASYNSFPLQQPSAQTRDIHLIGLGKERKRKAETLNKLYF